MSLKHILLGMLGEPDSGYNLVKRFEGSLNHFWSVKLSQVYPTLHAMDDDGWVESSLRPPRKGPECRLYRRTRKGDKELRRWLTGDPILHPPRYTFLAQTFFFSELEDAASARRFFENFQKVCRRRLAVLHQIEKQLSGASARPLGDLPDDEFYRYLTLRHGLMTLSVNLQWSEECLDFVNKRIRSHSTKTSALAQSPSLRQLRRKEGGKT